MREDEVAAILTRDRVSRRRFMAAAVLGSIAAALAACGRVTETPRLLPSTSPAAPSTGLSRATPVAPSPVAPSPVAPSPEAIAGEASSAAYPPAPAPGPDATLGNYRSVVLALTNGAAPGDVPFLPAFIAGDVAALSPGQAYRQLLATSFVVDIFHDYASAELRRTLDQARRDGTARATTLAWRGGQLAQAAVLAFRRTRDRRFLDIFVRYFDGVLKLRDKELGLVDDFHHRTMAAWGDGGLVRGRWIAHVTTAARICYPATEFARITLGDDRLSVYHQTARRYVDATKHAIAEFDSDYVAVRGKHVSYYYRPTTGRSEPINHVHQVGNVLLDLHALTNRQAYRKRASEIAAVFTRSVKVDRNGFPYWRYFPYFNPTNSDEKAEKTWKASLTVPFVYRAAQDGLVDATLVEAIARSFTENVVRDGEMNRHIDPTSFVPVPANDEWVYRVGDIPGWLEYAPIQPGILGNIVDLMATHRRDYFRGGWLHAVNSSLGYAYCLGGGSPGNIDADALS